MIVQSRAPPPSPLPPILDPRSSVYTRVHVLLNVITTKKIATASPVNEIGGGQRVGVRLAMRELVLSGLTKRRHQTGAMSRFFPSLPPSPPPPENVPSLIHLRVYLHRANVWPLRWMSEWDEFKFRERPISCSDGARRAREIALVFIHSLFKSKLTASLSIASRLDQFLRGSLSLRVKLSRDIFTAKSSRFGRNKYFRGNGSLLR